VRKGQFPESRLTEAWRYAERALETAQTLEPSSAQIWEPLGILADIAEQQGRAEVARVYRRREHEAFATFAGNRH